HDMKKTGRAPLRTTISLCFFADSTKTDLSCGWMGHWLQSIMMTASNCRPGLLKAISLSPTNEYLPMPFGRRYDSTSCQSSPEPLIVTDTPRRVAFGSAARARFET